MTTDLSLDKLFPERAEHWGAIANTQNFLGRHVSSLSREELLMCIGFLTELQQAARAYDGSAPVSPAAK